MEHTEGRTGWEGVLQAHGADIDGDVEEDENIQKRMIKKFREEQHRRKEEQGRERSQLTRFSEPEAICSRRRRIDQRISSRQRCRRSCSLSRSIR